MIAKPILSGHGPTGPTVSYGPVYGFAFVHPGHVTCFPFEIMSVVGNQNWSVCSVAHATHLASLTLGVTRSCSILLEKLCHNTRLLELKKLVWFVWPWLDHFMAYFYFIFALAFYMPTSCSRPAVH